MGLGYIYPKFITTLSHYTPARNEGGKAKNWQKCLFTNINCRKVDIKTAADACTKVVLSETQTEFVTNAIKFSKVSARCFKVFYTGPADKVDIQVFIESNNKKIINSIRTIGYQTKKRTGSNQVIKVLESQTGHFPDYPSTGIWELTGVDLRGDKRLGDKSVTLIVSNVATTASQTYAGNETVKFNFSYYLSTGNVQTSN